MDLFKERWQLRGYFHSCGIVDIAGGCRVIRRRKKMKSSSDWEEMRAFWLYNSQKLKLGDLDIVIRLMKKWKIGK